MVPKAKKNLHECEFHINQMLSAAHMEDLEINYSAFVSSARNITFILQKEFKDTDGFLEWYGNPNDYKNGIYSGEGDEPKDTKIYEMRSDELCKYFGGLRNQIVKEGINSLVCSTHISSLNTGTDLIDQPPNSSLEIGSNGMYYRVHKGTPYEDRIPAKTRGVITTKVHIQNAPQKHLGVNIPEDQRDVISLSRKYLDYLKSIVEEWTGIINSKQTRTRK